VTLLAALVAFGSYVRLAHLGDGEFRVDELYQVFAAESLARGEGPRMPSGEMYRRGLDVTHMVRLSFDVLGPSTFSARLPSALLGVLGLVLFAIVLWLMAGPWPAVIGTALFAVYPEAVSQSRTLRFYTYQLALGVGALYTGWRTVREAGRSTAPPAPMRWQHWGWAAATAVLLVLAARAQIVTLSVAAGWGACLLAAALLDVRQHGRQAWRLSVPLQLLAAVSVLFLAVALVHADPIREALLRARSVPFWILAAGEGTSPLAYYYSLSETYPVLLALAPLIFLAAILRRPRLGLYLTLWFGVPLFLHSFWLTWKGARFVLIPMLGLFAAAAIAGAWGGTTLQRYLVDRAADFPAIRRFAPRVATTLVAVIGLTAFVTLPAFNQSRKLPRAEQEGLWAASAEILHSRSDLQDLPWGQVRPLHPLYYWGRVDFLVGRARLVQAVERDEAGEWTVDLRPGGSPDRTGGVPVFTSSDEIRQHFADAGGVVIGIDTTRLRRRYLDDDLIHVLAERAEDLCQGQCGSMRLFLWRFDPPTGTPAAP
jgi:hypothetical protein